MNPVFPARRRAEEFASAVENPSTLADARYAEFLEIVAELRAAPVVEPRPAFVSSLREQLMVAAQTELVPASPDARLVLPARRPRDRRIAAAVGGLAIVGATTSMAVAAQSALPGDVLYPLKRAIENVHTGISVDEGERGVTLLASAEGRLDEITALSREGRLDDPDVVADTLDTFTAQAIEASDYLLSDYASSGQEDSIDQLREFTSESMETLVALEAVIPPEARDELVRAAMALSAIDDEARQACPTCAGAKITELPAILTAAGAVTPKTIEDTTVGTTGTRPGKGQKGAPKPGGTEVPEANAGDGNPLPGGVLTPPDDNTGDDTGTGDETDTSDNPIGDLTEGLTNGETASNGNGNGGLPGLEETVEDTVEGVVDPLSGESGTSKK